MAMILLLTISAAAHALPLQSGNERLTMPQVAQLPDAEVRQFIGSSVIGGLMWPVLVTLALTAIMARVPDFFQSLFSIGSGGRSFGYDPRLGLLAGPDRSQFWEQKLEETLHTFLRATDSFDDEK